jgi:hypothetical protein
MLWLTWRQHRAQALITTGLLAALGTFLLVHGLRTTDIVNRLRGDPDRLSEALGKHFTQVVDGALTWMPLAPALIGLFWGAPVLAKEFERGTHRLAWTQSVSQRRWLAVKLGVLAPAVALAGLALGAMISAWLATFAGTQFGDRFSSVGMFVVTGVVPGAWWLFAFVVGVAAGAVFRRTLPAIAVTLTVLLAAIVSMFAFQVRDHYATPERAVLDAGDQSALRSDSMIVRSERIDADGRVVPDSLGVPECVPPAPCERYRDVVYYHPPERYWRFQWTETALLMTATLALGVVAVERTSRRRL